MKNVWTKLQVQLNIRPVVHAHTRNPQVIIKTNEQKYKEEIFPCYKGYDWSTGLV